MRIITALITLFLIVAAWQRLAPLANALLHSSEGQGFAVGLCGGFIVGYVVLRGVIWNSYVESDRRNAHADIDKKHDAKRV